LVRSGLPVVPGKGDLIHNAMILLWTCYCKRNLQSHVSQNV
jgi:hypothetical protein